MDATKGAIRQRDEHLIPAVARLDPADVVGYAVVGVGVFDDTVEFSERRFWRGRCPIRRRDHRLPIAGLGLAGWWLPGIPACAVNRDPKGLRQFPSGSSLVTAVSHCRAQTDKVSIPPCCLRPKPLARRWRARPNVRKTPIRRILWPGWPGSLPDLVAGIATINRLAPRPCEPDGDNSKAWPEKPPSAAFSGLVGLDHCQTWWLELLL